MTEKKSLTALVLAIALLAAFATCFGIFSSGDGAPYYIETIRGKTVSIYGEGIYRHMSADVAIQGIAQDYVTLFLGIPLLLAGFTGYRSGSVRARFVMTGGLGYFFVTYLFYTAMAMYNPLFLCYVALMGLSFFALVTCLRSFDLKTLPQQFSPSAPVRLTGSFLIFCTISIGLMWLSIILAPLMDGSIYPDALEHYTTLIVQGFDLGLLLPLSFVSGWKLIKRKPLGYLSGTTYIVFLVVLMTALSAKIAAMGMHGVDIIPAVFIIPAFNLIALILAVMLISKVKGREVTRAE